MECKVTYNDLPRSFDDRLYLEMLLMKPSPALVFMFAGLAIPFIKTDFLGVEVDEDLGVGYGVVDAVGEGVAEGLEEMEGAFVAGGVAVVADDGEDGAVGAEAGDGDEVAEASS